MYASLPIAATEKNLKTTIVAFLVESYMDLRACQKLFIHLLQAAFIQNMLERKHPVKVKKRYTEKALNIP